MTNPVIPLFEKGKRYTFNTTVPSILGETFTAVKYCGDVSYEVAKMIESVDIKHRQLYHHLTGIPDNPAAFSYHIFEGADSVKTVLAEPWINTTSIVMIQATSLTAVIENINIDDVDIIRRILLAGGYRDMTITVH